MKAVERSAAAVFPTHVGMNRGLAGRQVEGKRVPHTRGDEPLYRADTLLPIECSPHTWG